jgi:hypothetical protein
MTDPHAHDEQLEHASGEGAERGDARADGSKRALQAPIGDYQDGEQTWLSPNADDDPRRDEAAERASRAVEPGRERE